MPGYYQGLLQARGGLADIEQKNAALGLLGLQRRALENQFSEFEADAPLRLAKREAEIAQARAAPAVTQLKMAGEEQKLRGGALELIQNAKKLFMSVGDAQQLDQANAQFEQLTGRPSPYRGKPYTPDFQNRVFSDLSTIEQRLKAREFVEGKVPAGYRRTAQGMQAVPGGPSDPNVVGAEMQAKEQAKLRAAEAQKLPESIATSQMMVQNIDELLQHPALSSVVGTTLLPGARYLHGTPQADFMRRLEQITGGVFMEAYKTLKGGGQITEIEGQKATAALNRMDISQSEAEFKRAAREFQEIVRKGMERARRAAGGGAAPAGGGSTEGWSIRPL